MLDSRRMTWFGKSLTELRTCLTTYDNAKLPTDVKAFHVAARFFFAVRWAIENVMILYKHGILKYGFWPGSGAPAVTTGSAGGAGGKGGLIPRPPKIKWQDINVLSKKVWTGAIVCGLITEICKLRRIWSKMEDIRSDIRERTLLASRAGEAENGREGMPSEAGHRAFLHEETNSPELEKCRQDRNKCFMTILQHLGDSGVPAVIAWKFDWSDTRVGLMHCVSSLLQCKNLYPA